MDFDTYETFLENLTSVMNGINCLIQKAMGEHGKRFVWSPISPGIVERALLITLDGDLFVLRLTLFRK